MTPAEALAAIREHPEAKDWLTSRPTDVQRLIEQMPPMTWWRLKAGGFGLYTPVGYSEDGTIRVQRHDAIVPLIPYEVFGCHPEDFEWTPVTPDDTPETIMEALR